MEPDVFEIVYILGFAVAGVIRSYYGLQFKRTAIKSLEKESPIVFIGMALWGVALLLPFVVVFSSGLMLADYKVSATLQTFGSCIFIGGLWVLWRSHVDLATNFSPSLFIRKDHVLVTTGIYRRIRHPMYLSFVMWATGQALLIDNWLAGPLGLVAFAMIYLFRVRREERQLLNTFGEEYREYQQKTGRLLPRIG